VRGTQDMTYRPLPDFLEIRKSEVDGHGLFTNKNLPPDLELGITHVKDGRFQDGYIRTPLGGFYNHSEEPNCVSLMQEDLVKLRTIREIKKDEELTAFYWLYELGEKDEY
jgi:SET domain-containing protein